MTTTEKRLKHGSATIRHKALSFLEPEGNSVVSPLSIMGAMYLTAACTKPGSPSEREIIDNLWAVTPVSKTGNKVGNEPPQPQVISSEI